MLLNKWNRGSTFQYEKKSLQLNSISLAYSLEVPKMTAAIVTGYSMLVQNVVKMISYSTLLVVTRQWNGRETNKKSTIPLNMCWVVFWLNLFGINKCIQTKTAEVGELYMPRTKNILLHFSLFLPHHSYVDTISYLSLYLYRTTEGYPQYLKHWNT